MSYLVIARKWRPQTFEDVVGQIHVTRTLQNAISAGRVAHGYLFTGPRGVGKTSTARILAKALNCEKGPTPHPCQQCPACLEIAGPGSADVIEIDGASNNSVDDIRSLREKVQYTGLRDRHKVYIIDEVHMLTNQAFNALLKTLEEPPPHVIFIFATTEVQKVPATILSRTQRFDFRRVGAAEVASQLDRILKAEGLEASSEALQLVARAGGGSVRDSQTLLDQVISFALGAGEKRALGPEDVLAVLGGVQEGQALGALSAALQGDAGQALAWLQQQYQRGVDLRQVLEAFRALLRALILMKAAPQAPADADLLPETLTALARIVPELGLNRLATGLRQCAEAEQQLRYTSQARLVLELLILKLAPLGPEAALGEVVDELRNLEQRLRTLPAQPLVQSAQPLPVEVAAIPSDAGIPEPVVDSLVEVATSPLAELSLDSIRLAWDAVVESVQEQSLKLASAAKDAGLEALEGGTLTLKVLNNYQRQVLEDPLERQKLEAALSERFAKPLKVRIVQAQAAVRSKAGVKPGPEELEKLYKESPEVKRVQELFGAEIVEIRPQE